MIQLAHLFLGRLSVPYEFHGYSDLTEISKALADEDFSNCDVVVTFGYALVQVRGNPTALGDFATLIACVFPSHSCIMAAADAHHNGTSRLLKNSAKWDRQIDPGVLRCSQHF